MNVSGRTDLVAGLLVALFGAGLAWMAQAGYPLGTLRRMGPGMFPLGLGLAIAGLGLALAAAGWLRGRAEAAAPPDPDAEPSPLSDIQWRVAVLTLAGVIAFALLIQRAGLIPAAFAVVAISAFADRRNTALAVVLLGAILCVLAVLVFKLALGMSFHLLIWPF
jgi:hypothetical protein